MDEYAREISELQVQADQLAEAEEQPDTVAELEIQIEVLTSLYQRASELLARGESDGDLRRALGLRGYGEWNLDNVYAFVYEAAIDQPAGSHREFMNAIRQTDFGSVLEAPLRA